jgi:hypothetical protein
MVRSHRKLLALGLALVAAISVGYGARRTHRAYEQGKDNEGLFRRISEAQLVIDSTFGGVELKDGKLFSTYDRAVSAGKRACPT